MKDLTREITNIVGKDNILNETDDLKAYAVDGKKPSIAVFPESVEEISEIMKLASREKLAVTPLGRMTKIGFGREPERLDIVLSTKNLNRLISHESEDLVAAAESGMSLKGFQELLREENQFLPIDPPHAEKGATLGGIVAANDSGPKRLYYGTARSLLLGLKVVRADGSVINPGSKVVKNVAGYDVPKLYVGSLGTLGIIVETTFRLYPIPEVSETYLLQFSNLEKTHDAVLSLLNSDLVPSSLEIINPSLTSLISDVLNFDLKKDRYTLAVRVENVEKAVRDQISEVTETCRALGGEGTLIENDDEEKFWHEMVNTPWIVPEINRTACKVGVVITDVPKVFKKLEEISEDFSLSVYMSASAGSGILIISFGGEIESIGGGIRTLRDSVRKLKGSLVIRDAPALLKSKVEVWGEIGSSLSAMKRLKSFFDRDYILSPGRFI